jgi:ERCC4-type nuclease
MSSISKLVLRIDTRENYRDRLIQSIRQSSHSSGGEQNVVVEALAAGDFIFEWDSTPILVIERKSLVDYAQSIRDGRHREQKRRLVDSYGKERVLYLVEGDFIDPPRQLTYSKITVDTIVSSIVNSILRDQIHVFHTASDHESIEFLTLVYKKLAKGIDFMNEEGVDQAIQKSTADYLFDPTKTIKSTQLTPPRTFQLMLQCIPGVSAKVSERILSAHTSMTDFIAHLQSFDSYNETVVYLETIGDAKRKIPKTTVAKVLEYLGIYGSASTPT